MFVNPGFILFYAFELEPKWLMISNWYEKSLVFAFGESLKVFGIDDFDSLDDSFELRLFDFKMVGLRVLSIEHFDSVIFG